MPRSNPDMRAQLVRDILMNNSRVFQDPSGIWRIDMPGWTEFAKRLNLVFCQTHSRLAGLGDAIAPTVQLDSLPDRVRALVPYLKGIMKNPSKYPLFEDVQRCLAARGQYAHRLMQLSSHG